MKKALIALFLGLILASSVVPLQDVYAADREPAGEKGGEDKGNGGGKGEGDGG